MRTRQEPPPDRTAITAALLTNRAELGDVEERRTELYAERVSLFRRARSLVPPITQRELAELAGVSEPAVINSLKKAAERQAS